MKKLRVVKKCRIEQMFRNGRLVRFRVRERSGPGEYRDVDGESLRTHLASVLEGQKAMRILAREVSRQCRLEDVVKKVSKPARSPHRSTKTRTSPKSAGDGEPNS